MQTIIADFTVDSGTIVKAFLAMGSAISLMGVAILHLYSKSNECTNKHKDTAVRLATVEEQLNTAKSENSDLKKEIAYCPNPNCQLRAEFLGLPTPPLPHRITLPNP